MEKLLAIVSLLVALSVASERLVEIVKGFVPALNGKSESYIKEGMRRAWNQSLAVAAGIVTAFLARPAIPADLLPVSDGWSVLALGLLASGGSGLWNSVLEYLLMVKDIKEATARRAREQAGLTVPTK